MKVQPIKLPALALLAWVTVLPTHDTFAQNVDIARPDPAADAAAHKAAAADPMLAAMLSELDRERSLLLLPGTQRPYFIEYRLDDYESYEAVANYGALTSENHNHQRVARVTVRIGDYTVDSSTNRGDGAVQLAPEENDPDALRYALWTATDDAYKNALRAYASKQAALKRFEKPQTEKDFSPSAPVLALEPLVTLKLDEPEWTRRIVAASGAFLAEPSLKTIAPYVEYSSANIRGLAINRYQVNTEGSVLRHGFESYAANYSVGGQAADGMRLSRDNGSSAVEAGNLESAEAFRLRAVRDVNSFADLRAAPIVEADDYHGPVLFSGDAAADVFAQLFVSNVEAARPDIGTAARTNGAYQSSLRTKVLSELLNVVDDPTRSSFRGTRLFGAYKVDDEGIPAHAVQLVDHGKLEAYLIGRTPVRDFAQSNGHGRAAPGQAAHSASGVLLFEAVKPTSAHEMHQKLFALAKEQGRDVYEVETMGGELTPRLLYRVHPDGTRQLVRGAAFDELDTRSLRSEIEAVGDDPYIDNSFGAIPTTIIAPSLLFGDIEVKRANEEQQKLPYYAPPVAGQTAPAGTN